MSRNHSPQDVIEQGRLLGIEVKHRSYRVVGRERVAWRRTNLKGNVAPVVHRTPKTETLFELDGRVVVRGSKAAMRALRSIKPQTVAPPTSGQETTK